MKRTRTFTKLITLLLSCAMLLGMIPTVAMAASTPVAEIPIEKIVTLGTSAQAPEQTFTFNFYDYDYNPLDDVGVKVAENTIVTNGEGTYDGYLSVALDAQTVVGSWFQLGTTTAGLFFHDFIIAEQNDGIQDWTYDYNEYTVRIFYDQDTNEATYSILSNNMEELDKASFTNTYGSDHSFSIPVEKTVEQEGTKAPSEKEFTFELAGFEEGQSLADYGITMINNTITTDGVGTYSTDLIGVLNPDMITEDNGWRNIQGSYMYYFELKEVNDNADGWDYSQSSYSIEIWFNPTSGNANATIYIPENDVTLSKASFTNIYTMDEMETVSFTVKKTDKDGNPLAGAVFSLTGTGNSIGNDYEATSGKDGIATFDVPQGFYDLAEKTAPDGYIKSDETYAISIFDGGVYFIKDNGANTDYTDYETVTFVNEKKPSEQPKQTGDNSNMFIWIFLMFIACAGIVGTTVYSRKRSVR